MTPNPARCHWCRKRNRSKDSSSQRNKKKDLYSRTAAHTGLNLPIESIPPNAVQKNRQIHVACLIYRYFLSSIPGQNRTKRELFNSPVESGRLYLSAVILSGERKERESAQERGGWRPSPLPCRRSDWFQMLACYNVRKQSIPSMIFQTCYLWRGS